MRHSSPNRPSRDTYSFWFFFHVICCKASENKYRIWSVRFFEKKIGVNTTQNNSKHWKFKRQILCAKTKFLSHGQKWARLWLGSYEKMKMRKKNENENYWTWWFLIFRSVILFLLLLLLLSLFSFATCPILITNNSRTRASRCLQLEIRENSKLENMSSKFSERYM